MRNFFKVIFLLIFAFISFSCGEIGLGSAVDTENPKVQIDYPPLQSVVRDYFVLSGSCSDDREVVKIDIQIFDKDNKEVSNYTVENPKISKVAEEKKSQVWSVNVNHKIKDANGNETEEYPLKDGKYTFRAIAYDAAGRVSSKAERDYIIDNTAPVFILTNPSSALTASPFGSILNIEGEIAEENSVKSMVLSVYNNNTNELITSWKRENINIAGSTNETFAKYSKNQNLSVLDNSLKVNYEEIYDVSLGGFQNFSISIEVEDGAKIYQEDILNSESTVLQNNIELNFGNKTTDLWLYDSIYGADAGTNALMGDFAATSDGNQTYKSYQIRDLMAIKNGTSTESQDNIEKVNRILENTKIDTSKNKLPIKINKDANPTYTVMGYNYSNDLIESLELKEAVRGGTIAFKADCGLDGGRFTPEKIKIYLVGPLDPLSITSELINEMYDDPIKFVEHRSRENTYNKLTYEVLYDGANGVQGKPVANYGPYQEGGSKDTWTHTLVLPAKLSSQKAYFIVATGEDKDQVAFVPQNGDLFGLKAKPTGVPPIVVIQEPVADSFSNNVNNILTIKGYIEAEDDISINHIECSIEVYDELNQSRKIGTINVPESSITKIGTLGTDSRIEFEIDATTASWVLAEGVDSSIDGRAPLDENSYKYAISVFGTTDNTGKEIITCHVDKKRPDLSDSEIQSFLSIEKDNQTIDNCINGKFTVKGKVTDNDMVSKSWVEIYDENNTKVLYSEEEDIVNASSFSFECNSTNLTDNSNYIVKISSEDRAGNIGEWQKEIYVNQDSDKPQVVITNIDQSINLESDISTTKDLSNLFDRSANNKILGSITDDDKIYSVKFEYKNIKDAETEPWTTFFEKTKINTTFYNLSAVFNKSLTSKEILSEGAYKIRYTIIDKDGDLNNGAVEVSNKGKEFVIAIDENDPELIIITEQNSFQSDNVVVTGTVSDGSGEVTLEREGINIPLVKVENAVKPTWNFTDNFESGNTGSVKNYIVKDKYGKTVTKQFAYNVDKVAPEIVINSPSQTSYLGIASSSTTQSFSGTASDGTSSDSSGIKAVQYSLNQTDWVNINGTVNWNTIIDMGNTAGEKIVYFRAVDNANNYSQVKSVNVIVDDKAPILNVVVKDGTNILQSIKGTYYASKNINAIINVQEENLLSVVSNNGTITKQQDGTYSLLIENSNDYVITATDKANQVSSETIKVLIDKVLPEAEITSIDPIVNENDVNGIITIKGTASDNDNIKQSKLIIKQQLNGVLTDVTNTPSCVTEINNSKTRFEYTVDTTKLTDNALLKIIIEAEDNAGNVKTVSKDVNVNQETDKPVITFSNIDVNNPSLNLLGMGSNVIFGNVKDDDGIKSIEYQINSKTYNVEMNGMTPTTKAFEINVSKLGLTSGTYQLQVNAIDKYNISSNNCVCDINYDIELPKIVVSSIGEKSYSDNMWVPSSFVVNGTASDDSGVKGVYLQTDIDKTNNLITQNASGNKNVSWQYTASNLQDGSGTCAFDVVDIFGREYATEISYKIDTVRPEFINDTSATVEDLSKKIIIESGNIKTNTSNLSDTWFSQKAVSISGSVTEENLEYLYLIVNNQEPSAFTASSSLNGVSTFKTTYEFTEGTTNFKLKAKDFAGNEKEIGPFVINVDIANPVINNAQVSGILEGDCVNTDNITVNFNVEDSQSGVKEIVISDTLTFANELAKWTLSSQNQTVPSSLSFTPNFTDGSYQLYIRVVDKAQNKIDQNILSFIYDKTAPVVVYSTPNANSTVNKTISITGTIQEQNFESSLADPHLYIKTVNRTDYIELTDCNINLTDKNWTISNIDTTKIADGTAEFQLRVKDKAGNVIANDGNVLSLIIDQDSDRPEIDLSIISTDKNDITTLYNGVIAGTIKDDDVITSLEVQVVSQNSDGSFPTIQESNWQNVAIQGVNWSYEYTNNQNASIDGKYILYFRVTDEYNSVFTSSLVESPVNTLNLPKITYRGTNQIASGVTFDIDTTPPQIASFEFATSKDNITWTDYAPVGNNQLLGGVNYRYAKFRIDTYDTISNQDELNVSLLVAQKTCNITLNKQMQVQNTTDRYYYISDVVDFENVPSGSYTAEVNSEDKAKKPKTLSLGIIVDNTSPVDIKNVKPVSTDEVTGDIVISGQVADDKVGNSGISALYYVVPVTTILNPQNIQDYNSASFAFGSMWYPIEGNVSWEFTLESRYLINTNANNISIKDEFNSYQVGNSGVYNLPIWFKIVDNAGNVGYVNTNTIRYNPDGDKPRVSITFPTHNITDSSNNNFGYVVMGGTVKFTGTADDDEGIEAVYLQFDMDGDDVFENGLTPDGQNVLSGCPYSVTDVVNIKVGVAGQETDSGVKGIKTTGSRNWNYSLDISNLSGLLYENASSKTLNVRAIALDTGTNDKKILGAFSETVHISVNNDVPVFESVYLVQEQNGSPSKQVEYTVDKFISGSNWYLEGTISSKAGIKSIEVYDENSVKKGVINIDTASSNNIGYTDANNYIKPGSQVEEGGNCTKLSYKIPVDKDSFWKIRIDVTDNAATPKSNYREYSLNIDNVAPDFYDKYSTAEHNEKGTIKLYKGNYGLGGVIISEENYIENSNGQLFTLAGRVVEAGSGYDKVLFYFKRVPETVTESNPSRVYNPMEEHGSDNSQNRSNLVTTKTDGKVYINQENLPCLYVQEVTRDQSNEFSLQSDFVINNKNIRPFGLVKLGGVYRTITSVDYDTGTVDFTPSCDALYTEAEFIYAMVIDHSGESLKTDNSIKGDDGDGMVESFSKSGNDYTWDASINSSNIPDGPIELHIVAFDVAGNANHGYTKTKISNNAPRITSVLLGTDLNKNNKYDISTEFTKYNAITEMFNGQETAVYTKGKEVWNLDTSITVDGQKHYWIAKKDIVLIPEFVGGTTPFYYMYNMTRSDSANSGLTVPTKKTTDIQPILLKETNTSITGTYNFATENTGGVIVIDNSLLSSNNGEDYVNTYSLSIWDSTEETVVGTNSQWAILNVLLKQDITDNTPPVADVYKFYWQNEEINSIYGSSRGQKYTERLGHIDLPLNDDKSFNTEQNVSSSTEDAKPAVSGIVEFTGRIFDETLLSDIYVNITDYTFTNATKGSASLANYYKLASFDSTSNSWTVYSSDVNTNGWAIQIEGTPTQDGHEAYYKLIWNSDKITGHAKENVSFDVIAVDKASNNSTKASYGKGIDVVPYIVNVEVYLDVLKQSNPSVFSRSSLGNYVVKSDEVVRLHGLNLTGAKYDTTALTKNTTVTSIYDVYDLDVGNITSSGNVNITVNNVTNRNNTHDYTPEYNKQANNANNDNLVDNISFDVWQINNQAVKPISGRIEQPIMKVNPLDGKLVFAFKNGPLYFSMGGYTSNDLPSVSYDYWCGSYDFFTSVGLAVDSQGYSYGCAAGGDINDSQADNFCLFTSRWGISGRGSGGSYDGTNSLRLEKIGELKNNVADFIKDRVLSPSMATAVHGTKTDLFMAYYDDMNQEIRFKAGQINSDTKSGFGNFVDQYQNRNLSGYSYNTNNVCVLSDSTYNAGEYVSVAVVSSEGTTVDDKVVVVWYDATNQKLWYTYKAYNADNQLTTNVTKNTKGYNNSGFSQPVAVFGNKTKVGEYCKVVADKNGGIHIAAYDSNSFDLVYAYASSYNATTFNTCTVDSADIVGEEITLDVVLNSQNKAVPYIGYYMASAGRPKQARYVNGLSVQDNIPLAGSDSSELFTGNWDISLVPTSSTVPNDHINIGVWKDKSTGVLKASTVDLSYTRESERNFTNSAHHSGNSGYDSYSYGHVVGNGSTNAMLSYQIKEGTSGYIETAQKK